MATIRTARLRLSPHGLADFEDSAALWADPEVVRYISGKPSTLEESWSRLHRYVGHWTLLGFGYWAVREAASGRFVGEVGFADFKREMTPSFDGAIEAGWVLAPSAHGQGFATEAMTAALTWARALRPGGRTTCMIDPANAASIRVAERCGYQRFADGEFRGSVLALFERTL